MTTLELWTMIAALGTAATAVATFAVVMVAMSGLAQIGVSKDEIRTRSKREAIAAAIAQCDDFRVNIIRETGGVLQAFADQKIQLLLLDVRFANLPGDIVSKSRGWAEKLPPEVFSQCVHTLNHLEAFAMNFTTRYADAETAYKPTSDVFCRTVLQLYPVIVNVRATQGADLYSNIAKLYTDWAGKKTGAELEAQARRLQQKADEVAKKGYNPTHLPPLGTD